MCGIFGFVRPLGSVEPSQSDLMATGLEAIRARGPDGQGNSVEECAGHTVSLLHTRLSVIDLSELGQQPMYDEKSGWHIVFNGEIYNYIELRDELKALGWSFRSASDTEVLLKAWAQWGLAALPRLNGMFALAAFNARTRELWLVRDRFGVKPLLWGRLPGKGMAFSSSAAVIASLIEAEVDLDYCARGARYTVFELPESGSPFKQVRALPGGGWLKLKISDHGVDISEGQWYWLEEAVNERISSLGERTDAQLLEECSHVLQDAVRLRLRSDVPLAVSLSGGLDSSSVAALAARDVVGLKGFTYGSPEAVRSEGPVVAAFARRVGIGAEFIWPRYAATDLSDLLERVLAFQEAPFGGLSVLAQNEVFRAVRGAGVKVLLGGQGGDEAFAGYRKFFVVALREAVNNGSPREVLRYVFSMGLMLWHEAGQARKYWQALGRYDNRRASEFKLFDWEPPSVNLWGNGGSTLRARQIKDIQKWSIPTLLRYEDRNSTGYGLESRLPFMDFRLVELAMALPTRLKIARGFGKWALRNIGAGSVPDSIRLNRRKRGFDVTQSWVTGGLGASLRRRAQDHHSTLAPYLHPRLDIEKSMSDERLASNENLLREALMLAWLAQPIRLPQAIQLAA